MKKAGLGTDDPGTTVSGVLRARAIRSLGEPFDLIVVGGGINGCGIAWDAALRGLRVLLVERDDVGSGTSSWSSRLIHGGLKYLEKLDVKLVRESLREREWLLGAAPHLVRPLRMILPFYAGGKHRPLELEAGMVAYDLLSWGKSVPRHSLWSREGVLRRVPGLEPEGLRGAAAYFDAQAELAERLCVEVALAARASGAVVLNHASVDRLEARGGRVTGVELTDGVTGRAHRARAPVVLNAAGPWADRVLAGVDAGSRLIGGTKGSHFILDPFPGAPADALYYEAKSDGRAMMVLPWRGRYMIGSTDARFEGDLDRIGPSVEEADYVLRETNRVLPRARLTEDDLLWGYTGVRPLPYTSGGPRGTSPGATPFGTTRLGCRGSSRSSGGSSRRSARSGRRAPTRRWPGSVGADRVRRRGGCACQGRAPWTSAVSRRRSFRPRGWTGASRAGSPGSTAPGRGASRSAPRRTPPCARCSTRSPA